MDLLEDISILSWKVRGALSCRSSRRHVRDLVNSHHPSVFCLFETHGLFSKVERLWASLGYSAIFIQEARGHSGGIWVLSCRQDLTFTLISSMFQSITFFISKGMAKWACSAIYASPTYTARIELWRHLQNLRSNISIPWLMIGDFNEVKSIIEVSGCSFNYSRANIFRDMTTHCNMMDLDTEGGIFTWRRSTIHGVHMRKRLDRCMVDVDWRMSFPHATVELLSPHDSDHNPILLSCSKFRSIKSNLFHFQAAWISHPENKRTIEARLKGVHQQLDVYQTSDLILFERQLQQDYNILLAQEEMLWYQKSRENWPVLFEEVKAAIFSMESYKSPGPDGFQPIFFKTYWDTVGKDVWHLVSEAFSTGVIDPKLAETLIV
ncbi:RNA-directed DNA polymerase (Reverse transcriptase), partial [Trifolium medium]|nr:RNA-directed DNA polymerase (Reverse transcriptase) [Trifolium medium]